MPEYVYALHDFEPENSDEISFRAGERIEIIEKDDVYGDGWWQGRNESGAVGLFPQSYTTSVSPIPPGPPEPPIIDIHTPTTLHPLREEPENISVQGSPNPTAVSHGAGPNQNDEVMKATMTDVQKAIEQLGKNDIDGARSFSFASSREGDWTDREMYSGSETDADTDGEGEGWHTNARQKLAEKARRANQKAAVEQETPARLSGPPIAVELSDESEAEEDNERHQPQNGSSPFRRHHPYIPEEDENEAQSILKAPQREFSAPLVSSEEFGVPSPLENDVPTATAERVSLPWDRTRSPAPDHVRSNGVPLPTPITPTAVSTDIPFVAVKDNVQQDHPSSSPVVEKRDSQTTPIYHRDGLPSPTASSTTSVGIRQTLTPATASPLKSPISFRRDSYNPEIPKASTSDWTVEEVIEWLKSKGFDQPTCDKFIEQEITGDVLLELNVELLKTEIGIPAFGKRKRIANCIEELRKPPSIIESSQMTNSESVFSHSRTMSSAQHSLNSPSFFSTPAPFSAMGSVLSPESPPHTGDIPVTPNQFRRSRRGSDPGSVTGSLVEMMRANSRNSIIGLGIGIPGKSQKGRPANLSLYPSEGVFNAKAISIDNVITLDDHAALSENEAPASGNSRNSKAKRMRGFGRSSESTVSKDKGKNGDSNDSPSRNSKEISSPLSQSPTKQGSLEEAVAPARQRAKRSIDGNKASDRLSLFGNTFSGTLGKSRKPPPRYSSSLGDKSDNEKEKLEKSSLGALSKLYHYGDRKASSHRPATSDGKSSKELKDEKDRVMMRKRGGNDSPSVAGASGLKPGKSVLEQIGAPDYNGWMHKKGENYNAWKQRYFILKGPHLYWLRSNSVAETKIKGYINVAGYKIIPDENIRPGSYGFKMTHDQDKIHYFSSEAQIVVREWMKALMKSTIDRDYTKPVVSSVNIPTIPLTVAQAMSPPPRPPSPTARAATQRALRRNNPNQLSSRDAQILLMGVLPSAETRENGGERSRIESFFANDVVPSPVEATSAQMPTSPQSKAPPRPSREMRRIESGGSQPSSPGPVDDGLIEWANSHLPPTLRIKDASGSICGGLALLRLAESIKGKPSSPPVPDATFPSGPNDDKLDGLFRLFDFLLDNDVRIGSVSINDVRQGKRDKIIQLLRALKAWEGKMKAIALSIGNSSMQTVPPLVCATGGMPWIGDHPYPAPAPASPLIYITMSLDVGSIEQALFTGRWNDSPEKSIIVGYAQDVVYGSFRSILTSLYAKTLFTFSPSWGVDQPLESWFDFPAPLSGTSPLEGELLQLIVAIACLHAFVQANWTGPDLDVNPLDIFEFPDSATLSEETLNQKATSELAYGGEPAYHLARVPIFLRLADLLLSKPAYEHCRSVPWWRLRTWIVRQQVLDEPVAIPLDVLSSLLESTQGATSGVGIDPDVAGRILLEEGLLEHTLSNDRSAAEYFVKAARATGMEYELTGALGKRTKFQQTDVTQLVLLAQSRINPNDVGETTTTVTKTGPVLPETLALNDDTLLEKTEFTSSDPTSGSKLSHLDPNSQPSLDPLDQCILLALCLNIKNTSPAHGLTSEQMAPYVSRVISHPLNWSIHTMALLLRSRLESNRTRTVERSTLQLQALVDQMPTADSSVSERLLYFHSIALPSKWEIEKELALRFLSIGVVKSALEIFERLEMWEEVVKCWQAMERRDKGIAIVRDLLEGRKAESDTVISWSKTTASAADGGEEKKVRFDVARQAKLWCLLGDLEPEHSLEHYTRAWVVSNNTSGRAMRSLGGYHFARGEYPKAIDCLKRAVTINPLLSRSWFILGCAYVREEDWESGREAFTRCVSIDDEDGESWNNLATVYLRMAETPSGDETSKAIPFSNKVLAFRALKQAVKHSYENWRMWTNYMIVCMDVGELSEACRALTRVVELRSTKVGAECVDEDVLEKLVDAVTKASANPDEAAEQNSIDERIGTNPNEEHGPSRRVTDLLDRTILPRVASPRIYRAKARLLTWQSRWDDAIKAYLDAYRSGVAGSMEKGGADVETWKVAVHEVENIVDVLRNFGPRVDNFNWLLQAKSIIRTFLGKTRESFEDEPGWERLTELLEELKQ